MELSTFIVPLISALFGGSVVAALINHYLKKDERAVMLDKLRAETDKAKAETARMTRELQGVQANLTETADTVQQQQQQLQRQRDILDKLILFSMSGFIFGHLEHLWNAQQHGQPYRVENVETVREELKFLRDHGYIWDFNPHEILPGRNLAEVIKLTEIAQWFVPLRLATEKQAGEAHQTG